VVFDRELKRRQRQWANSLPNAEEYDYLRVEVAQRLVDRLEDVQRNFPTMLDVGCHGGHMYAAVTAQGGLSGVGGVGGVEVVVQGDSVEAAARRAHAHAASLGPEARARAACHTLMFDEETLPFRDGTFDLVTSNLSLHWVNDLPRALSEIRRVLKPDGCFVGAMLGGKTLTELREAMLLAETERDGGVSPHVSPMVSASDMGSLLSAAGFSMPTLDVDKVVCDFEDAFVLMEELQGMGEANAAVGRRGADGTPPTSRDTLLAAAAAYHYRASMPTSEEEASASELLPPAPSVPASFQVIYMIGWAPHSTQQRADKRGTATRKLTEISITNTKPPFKEK
jgi:NADH dehydrogenase [ubiquinone] 1 alpha subcomplex assembly factor 5